MSTPLPPSVDRRRRFTYIAAVTTFCLLGAAGFTLLATLGGGIPLYHLGLVETFINACMSLATATAMAYVTGSVIDYNAGKFAGNDNSKTTPMTLTTSVTTGAKG